MPYLQLAKGRLHYHKFGTGAKLMLALPGFGLTAELFKAFEEPLGSLFTIYAIDLPFHGATEWPESTFDKEAVMEWVAQVLAMEQRKTCILLGHSLGGRIWLSCLPELLPKVELLVLLAPDGIATRGMSLPDLIPIWGRKGMVQAVQKPRWILKLASWMYRSRLLSAFAFKYLKYHFRSIENQERLLHTWLSLGFFKLNLKKISKSLSEKPSFKIYTILGENDPLINMDKFKAKAKAIPQMEVMELPAGHQLIKPKVGKYLYEKLKDID